MLEQLELGFEKVPINEGDVLLFKIIGAKFFFINEIGFVTEPPVEGTLIETGGFGIGISVSMPACKGRMTYENGKALFLSSTPHMLLKLWDSDIITILKFPNFKVMR